MESKMQIFKNAEFGKVRTVVINEEPWFVGKDIATALGYRDTKNALKAHVDLEDKGGWRITTPSGEQNMTVINESGMYSLVLSSKLPSAKKFKRWVTSEVLPSIRKHGAYMTPEKIEEVLLNPDTIIKLAKELKAEQEKVKELTPKAEFYDTVVSSESLLSMGEVAKTLNMGIGRNNLFGLLRAKGILNFDNVPYQRFVNAGYFKLVERTYDVKKPKVATTTYVSQMGLDYIRKMLLKEGYHKKLN